MSLETKVGAFVLGGLTLLATAIFLLGDVSFEKRYILYGQFSDVANLSKDAPVKLSVEDVALLEGDVAEKENGRGQEGEPSKHESADFGFERNQLFFSGAGSASKSFSFILIGPSLLPSTN